MRVLAADDDADIRFVVASMLQRKGWEVTLTETGEQTIEVLEAEPAFDALVLDQNMPPGSGLEVISWVRARGETTPVVLFTGYVSSIDLADAAAHDVTVLDKVEVRRLADVVEQITSSR